MVANKLPGLAEARRRARLTQGELGALAGLHWVSISRLEHEQAANARTVRKLAQALGVKVSELLGTADDEEER